MIGTADQEHGKPESERTFPGKIVIYKNGRFMSWSAKEMRPVFYNRDPSDFEKTMTSDGGFYSWPYVSAWMRLAMQYGSSLGPSITPEELVKGNHLGAHGEELTLDEIFAAFVQEGFSNDLGLEFETIVRVGPRDVARDARSETEAFVQRTIEKHKQRMAELGFPFYNV